jgi:cell division protein FtsW (lipid II flippase)
MMRSVLAAQIFAVLTGGAVAFQLALAAGAPWGRLAWGGRFPGRLSPTLRWASVASALLLLAFGVAVCTRAGLMLPELRALSRTACWIVVGYCALGVLANAATPSKWERIVWLPVVALLLACSVTVALS